MFTPTKNKGTKVWFLTSILLISFLIFSLVNSAPVDKIARSSKKEKSRNSKIYSVIVPHHDLVKKERFGFWQKIASLPTPQNIILLSPNHFNTGESDLITTKKIWQLIDLQTIKPALNLIYPLIDKKLVGESESAFSNEHGILNLLEEIKNGAAPEKLKSINEELQANCQNQCLIIASVDFSHYQPQALADLHDLAVVRALSKMNLQSIFNEIEVDSPESLYLATAFAQSNSANQLQIINQTNSGKIENQRDSETTTHLFAYFKQTEEKPKEREKVTTFLFAGDIMLDRLVNNRFPDQDLAKIFANFGDRVFAGIDLAIANLEGPISDQPIKDDISPNNLNFNFPPKSPEVLKSIKLDAVSLANNHTLNAGESGFEITKKMLADQKLGYFGQQKLFDDTSVYHSTAGDLPVSVISLNLLEGAHQPALKEKIAHEKSAGNFVIIFPHWGNEYQTTHSDLQEQRVTDWINWGADLIIGSHPHVVQDAQIINGKPVFYSLGNFVFDQTFSQETQQGLMIAGKITKDELTLIPLPIESIKLQPQLVKGEAKTKILQSLADDLKLNKPETFNQQSGILKVKYK